jgi:hypothetical protein
MWAHYAGNGSGYCIEYEIDPRKNSENMRYVPVQYVSELKAFCVTEAIFSPHQFLYRAVSTKHVDWAYEKEVRLVSLEVRGE